MYLPRLKFIARGIYCSVPSANVALKASNPWIAGLGVRVEDDSSDPVIGDMGAPLTSHHSVMADLCIHMFSYTMFLSHLSLDEIDPHEDEGG
jgi:hypothetical protein